jgi:O-antigen/teichoic acid export membrane protein
VRRARVLPAIRMNRILGQISSRVYHSAAAWTLVFTVVRSCGNLLVLPLMLHKLPQEQLGLWYAFLSLAGLSSLIDMGFFPTMSRVTAYLWAGAEEIQKFGIAIAETQSNDPLPPNYRLLADLVKTMRLYYFALGTLTTLFLGIFGTAWLTSNLAQLGGTRTIISAWLVFLLAIFINTASGMWHSLLSGINQVRRNQQILVWSLVANYVITAAGLLFGFGLLAPVAGYLAMGFISRIAAQARFNRLTQASVYGPASRWSRTLLSRLWPTAWRTGFVTLGIYATLNANTLICTTYLGLKTTASFGLTLQLALAAMSVAAGFLLVKIPLIAQLRARGNRRELSHIVFPRLRWYWAVYVVLALAATFFGEIVLRDVLHSKTPLLAAPLLVALFVMVGLEGHHGLFREITLTSNENPFAKPVVISGILIVALSLILVQRIGVWGLILAPGIVQICFNNWWTVLVGLRSMGNSTADYLFALFGLNHPANTRQLTTK